MHLLSVVKAICAEPCDRPRCVTDFGRSRPDLDQEPQDVRASILPVSQRFCATSLEVRYSRRLQYHHSQGRQGHIQQV